MPSSGTHPIWCKRRSEQASTSDGRSLAQCGSAEPDAGYPILDSECQTTIARLRQSTLTVVVAQIQQKSGWHSAFSLPLLARRDVECRMLCPNGRCSENVMTTAICRKLTKWCRSDADYSFWKLQFGRHAGTGTGSMVRVPEPPTLMIALLIATVVACRHPFSAYSTSEHVRPRISEA